MENQLDDYYCKDRTLFVSMRADMIDMMVTRFYQLSSYVSLSTVSAMCLMPPCSLLAATIDRLTCGLGNQVCDEELSSANDAWTHGIST